jgi:hypothetical protein
MESFLSRRDMIHKTETGVGISRPDPVSGIEAKLLELPAVGIWLSTSPA